MHSKLHDLVSLLDHAPTAWHAVQYLSDALSKNGFLHLKEGTLWDIKPGKKYFTTRNGSSLCAFVTPRNPPSSVRLAASHVDSPALKLKPHAEFCYNQMTMLGVEVYGSPLLTSWLNRDLGIAGRVLFEDHTGHLVEKLVRLDQHPVVIPQLAIHLDPQVNESGLALNKQNHVNALASLTSSSNTNYLQTLLKEEIGQHEYLSSDLFLYPLERASFMGLKAEMLAAYRVDSLASVHAIWKGLTFADKPSNDNLKMAVFWDNEEIGSETTQGASSPFFSHTLEKILLAYGQSRKEYFSLIENSICVSVDLAHALHPNYPDRHDPLNAPILGKGIVLKSNAKHRYATDARTGALITQLCKKQKIPLQHFVSRGDMPCGSTIGPLHASLTGMATVDIGIPQLSMHACRELMACEDQLNMIHLMETFYLDDVVNPK